MVTLHEQACWLCYTYPTKQVLGAHWSGMKLMWLMDWIKSTLESSVILTRLWMKFHKMGHQSNGWDSLTQWMTWCKNGGPHLQHCLPLSSIIILKRGSKMVEWLSLIRFAKMLRNSLLRTVLHENTAAEKEDTLIKFTWIFWNLHLY